MSGLTWSLFLDDVRDPRVKAHNLIIARDFYDAVSLCEEKGCPDVVFFDHDLGMGPTGYDFAQWIVDKDIEENGNFMPLDFRFDVHSMNPIGKRNIINYLNSYLKFKRENK